MWSLIKIIIKKNQSTGTYDLHFQEALWSGLNERLQTLLGMIITHWGRLLASKGYNEYDLAHDQLDKFKTMSPLPNISRLEGTICCRGP